MESVTRQSETQTEETQRQSTSRSRIIQCLQLLKFPSQTFSGETLLNNLHGSGFYCIDKPNGKLYIDGLFFCNKLEGYGHVYYDDGSSFQGLFKNNKRFGPGVFSYPNGSQDVGIWNGFSLIRLSTPVHEFFLPKLAESYEGLAELRRYRYILPLGVPKSSDMIAEMVEMFAADGVLVGIAEKLYNSYVRNRNNIFFNTTLFDDFYFHEKHLRNPSDEQEWLKDQLKKMETIVLNIQEVKHVLFRKIEYCKTCCAQAENIDSVVSSHKSETETVTSGVKELSNNRKSSTTDDVSSNKIELMTFDESFSIIPISESTTSVNSEITQKIISCVCDEEMDIEDLALLEKQHEDLIKEELFYNNIRTGLRERLRKYSLQKRTNPVIEGRTNQITDVLVWNNEKLMIDILKHSFLHRKFESRINLNLSAIFESRRFIEFLPRGNYEKNCDNFLNECGTGYLPKILEYLRKPNVDVNVTDSRGNNAVFFAAAKKCGDIIRMLVNFGINLNQMNDEGLTPLNMCILNYLAEKNNIEDWEAAFLPRNIISSNERDYFKWYPGILGEIEREETRKSSIKRGTIVQTYFFDTKYRDDLNSKFTDDSDSTTDSKAENTLERNIEDATIMSLLHLGANPNIGEVPFPALILAMFSRNCQLVEELLKSGADIRIETPEENLNCLHILASLECNEDNVGICSILLKYGCDPNVKTDEQHWPDQHARIVGNYIIPEEFEDSGKNPLHMLCLRKDFQTDKANSFQDMAKLLIDFGININDTYLGLNALELAILSGNSMLVEFLLRTGLMDPYRLINPEIGNTLTLFLSERFKDTTPVDECKQMIELLVNLGVNPLHRIDVYENVIDFIDSSRKKGGNSNQTTLKNFLRSLTRKMLMKNISMKAVEYLYNLAEAELLNEEAVKILAAYLTSEQFIANIKLLFEKGRIPIERFDTVICQNVLDYVKTNGKQPKVSKKKKITDQLENVEFESLLDDIKISHEDRQSGVNYEVCFQCLKSHNKSLTKCPRCGMLYFCSVQCNNLNLKQKNNEHVCRLNLFEDTGDWMTDGPGLAELCETAENVCKEKLLKKKRQQMELERKKEEEERRLDVYGRRQLHKSKAENHALSSKTSANCDIRQFSSHKALHDRPSATLSKLGGSDTAVTENKMSNILRMSLNEKLQRLSAAGGKGTERKTETGRSKLRQTNMKHGAIQAPKKNVQKTDRDKCKAVTCKPSKPTEKVICQFEMLPNLEEPYILPRKTKKDIPKRPKFFIELLKKYFPNVDLSFLIVPYICYADGHLYYQFSDDNPCKNYSMS